MENIRIQIETNEDGRIIGWYEVKSGGYLLPSEELSRFSACSGNLYRVEGNALIFDETLDVITPPKNVSNRTYKCTGVDDNVAICEIIENFFNANDGVQNLKLSLEGVMGVNEKAFGNGSTANPYKVFCENTDNAYGKKVVLDGGNCTFPKVNYPYSLNIYAHYFNMKNVGLENIRIEMEAITSDVKMYGFNGCSNLYSCASFCVVADGTNSMVCGFSNCSNLYSCASFCVTADDTNSTGRGFNNCSNLFNCTGTGISSMMKTGYGFSVCSNLFNCTGTGVGVGGNGFGFSQCSVLEHCAGTAISNTNNSYGFYGCKRLESCKGYGYVSDASAKTGVGFFWTSSESNIAQMTNCTAPIKAKEGYKQTHGILLDGEPSGAKYYLAGNTVAPDVQDGFIGIKKHSATGAEYTETGTIRANVE